MRARYLLRFDDICPTMNWTTWNRLEPVLVQYRLKPILAVVPDNRDPKLQIDPPREEFWQWLREKQHLGWTIGMHGYQHIYSTRDPGLLGINHRSEFAGLSVEVQRNKVRNALAIFEQHGIRPQLFVAPAHSFDQTTLAVLREFGINTISDGFFLRAQLWLDIVWVPQQMWQLRKMPFGLWTVCYHHNRMREPDIARFRRDIERFHSSVISLDEAVGTNSTNATSWDVAFVRLWRFALLLKRRIQALMGTGG